MLDSMKKDLEEMTGPIESKYKRARELINSKKLNNKERFELFVYMVGNGLEPELASHVLLFGYHGWDNDAKRHIHWLWQNVVKLEDKEYQYWDEHLKKQVKLLVFK